MANSYDITLTNGTVDFTINEGETLKRHGLTFHGFQRPNYGKERNVNILRLAEHFASEEDPSNPGNPPPSVIDTPLVGQFWFDKTSNQMRIWSGSSWSSSFAADTTLVSGTYPVETNAASTSMAVQTTVTIPLNTSPVQEVEIRRLGNYDNFLLHINETSVFGPGDSHNADDYPVGPSDLTFFNTVSADYSSLPDDKLEFLGAEIEDDILQHIDSISGSVTLEDIYKHPSTAITVDDTSLSFTTADAQDAVEQLDADVTAVQNQATLIKDRILDHINVNANPHPATRILFDATGVPAIPNFINDVQFALLELNAIVTTPPASTSSVLDTVLARRTASLAYGTSATRIPFTATKMGDAENQFNLATGEFTAAFDQLVRVTLRVDAQAPPEDALEIEIRADSTPIARTREYQWAEAAISPKTAECSCLWEVAAGQTINGFVRMTAGAGTLVRAEMDIDVLQEISISAPPAPNVVDLTSSTYAVTATNTFAPAIASIAVRADGTIVLSGVAATTFSPGGSLTWHTSPAPGVGSNFRVRFDTFGPPPIPGSSPVLAGVPTNTWLNLSSDRVFTGTTGTTTGSRTDQWIMTIESLSNPSDVDTAVVDLSVARSI